jgi:dipeptidyl aminopeptidase/acylaminoacyl peptidase
MRIGLALFLVSGLLRLPLMAAGKEPFTFDAMMKLARIGDPQLSPDGVTVAFTVQTVDMAQNSKPTQIFVVSVNGGEPRQITQEGTQNARPRWTPDSRHIIFTSNRKDGSQVWSMNADGSGATELTNLPTEAEGEIVSPDGKLLLFTSLVYPACQPQSAGAGVAYNSDCNKKKLDEEAASKMHARTYSHLLYRHWTEYQGPRRSHLLIQSLNGGEIKDLTPGDRDVPPFSLGAPESYVFAPNSEEVTYVSNTDADLSTSTNSDLFTISVNGGEPKRITNNPAADEGPLYSPDGKYLAYRMQVRPGYESDLWRLAVRNQSSGQVRQLAVDLDRPVNSYEWSVDGKTIYFTVADHGRQPLLKIAAAGNGKAQTVREGAVSIDDLHAAKNGKTFVYTEQSGSQPANIYKFELSGAAEAALTQLNEPLLNSHQLAALESFSITSRDGTKVESFLVKPPDFDAKKKYPALFLIHGGPQGEWGESWSYRWNAQVFAAAGYVVVMPNPHGSTGYGQKFTDAVNQNWGGIPYEDIMKTADYVQTLSYVDGKQMVAAGASYGGYMIDWILGHTDRFKALVVHAGVYDLPSETGTTEELWFPKWEFGGFPWQTPDIYARWSPSNPQFVKNFKTPTLVTHGEIDYRVPVGQGQQLFTALQQQKVPSKLILFPDEGHWILKPQNSQFWYQQVLEWLGEYAKSGSNSQSAPQAKGN